jgi:hypothetical protein
VSWRSLRPVQLLAPNCPRCAAPMSAPAGSTELVCGTCGQRAPQGYAGPRGIDEAKARDRREGDRIQRNGAVAPLVAGVVLLALALPLGLLAWPLLGLFFVALGGGLVSVGARPLRHLALRKRLRTVGVRGFGTVLEWDESESSAGLTIYKMKLNVAVPGQHPYTVRVREISFIQSVYTNLTLPVLVDPANARNVVVDWDGR